MKKEAFTIVEVLIVVTIMALCSAIVIPSILKARKDRLEKLNGDKISMSKIEKLERDDGYNNPPQETTCEIKFSQEGIIFSVNGQTMCVSGEQFVVENISINRFTTIVCDPPTQGIIIKLKKK